MTCISCGKETKLQPRCHIGVFLNDETKTITTTLFSPEAEKLTGFTRYEIKEAADKNTHLTDEIARRIHKKPVFCFVKYHDKSFRGNNEITYPIVKVYNEKKTAAFRGTESVEVEPFAHVGPPPAATPELVMKEHQFFSPKTKLKLAIEEIENTSTTLEATSTKKGLLFTAECTEEVAIGTPSDVSASTTDVNTCSTGNGILHHPEKKVKGKDNEK